MENKSTLLAIGGVISIALTVIISSALNKQAIDSQFVQQVVTGLLAFSGGIGANMVANALKNDKTQ